MLFQESGRRWEEEADMRITLVRLCWTPCSHNIKYKDEKKVTLQKLFHCPVSALPGIWLTCYLFMSYLEEYCCCLPVLIPPGGLSRRLFGLDFTTGRLILINPTLHSFKYLLLFWKSLVYKINIFKRVMFL